MVEFRPISGGNSDCASEFDAVLHDWIFIEWPDYDGVYVIAGVVTGDRKGRFPHGRGIHTSMILTPVDRIREGSVVQTLNTRYLLGEARRRN
jgi:hypothetical protein